VTPAWAGSISAASLFTRCNLHHLNARLEFPSKVANKVSEIHPVKGCIVNGKLLAIETKLHINQLQVNPVPFNFFAADITDFILFLFNLTNAH